VLFQINRYVALCKTIYHDTVSTQCQLMALQSLGTQNDQPRTPEKLLRPPTNSLLPTNSFANGEPMVYGSLSVIGKVRIAEEPIGDVCVRIILKNDPSLCAWAFPTMHCMHARSVSVRWPIAQSRTRSILVIVCLCARPQACGRAQRHTITHAQTSTHLDL